MNEINPDDPIYKIVEKALNDKEIPDDFFIQEYDFGLDSDT